MITIDIACIPKCVILKKAMGDIAQCLLINTSVASQILKVSFPRTYVNIYYHNLNKDII